MVAPSLTGFPEPGQRPRAAPRFKKRSKNKVGSVDHRLADVLEIDRVAAGDADHGAAADLGDGQHAEIQTPAAQIDQIVLGPRRSAEVGDGVEVGRTGIDKPVGAAGAGQNVAAGPALDDVRGLVADAAVRAAGCERKILDVVAQRIGWNPGLNLVGSFSRELDDSVDVNSTA